MLFFELTIFIIGLIIAWFIMGMIKVVFDWLIFPVIIFIWMVAVLFWSIF